MRVTVINTGTELLLGDVLNKHLVYIARAIFPLGLRVARQVTIPDGDAIREGIAEAFGTSDLVFVTGGLGPTTDDITREVAAELLQLPMRQDPVVAAAIRERLERHRFPMTDRILRQADVPEGARVLPNHNGTAPGLFFRATENRGRTTPHLFLLPGPPRELHPMFSDFVMPILRELVPTTVGIELRTFSIACVGESVVEAAIGRDILALGNVELGYCAHAGAVDVRVIGPAERIAKAEDIITRAWANSIYTLVGESLEGAVVRLLIDRSETVTTAESCTGGFLAHRLTNVPGASAVFMSGEVTYANGAKTRELGVPPDLIASNGAVSEAVARAMAEGARANTGATYALATTGVAGPSGGSAEKPVGTVFVALASDAAPTRVEKYGFATDRQTFKKLATQRTLELLRQRLMPR